MAANLESKTLLDQQHQAERAVAKKTEAIQVRHHCGNSSFDTHCQRGGVVVMVCVVIVSSFYSAQALIGVGQWHGMLCRH